jgi:hypothetical protein
MIEKHSILAQFDSEILYQVCTFMKGLLMFTFHNVLHRRYGPASIVCRIHHAMASRSVAAGYLPHRLLLSERGDMAVKLAAFMDCYLRSAQYQSRLAKQLEHE